MARDGRCGAASRSAAKRSQEETVRWRSVRQRGISRSRRHAGCTSPTPRRRSFVETYGFAGNQGMVNLEGVLLRPKGQAVEDADGLHAPHLDAAAACRCRPPRRSAARRPHPVRRQPLSQERHRADHGEGGCSTSAPGSATPRPSSATRTSSSSAGPAAARWRCSTRARPRTRPSSTTPAGDPVDLKGAGLIPADALIFQAAHISRARMLLESIDPSVIDEADPDDRDTSARHLRSRRIR